MSRYATVYKEAVPGNGTTKIALPPHLNKATVLSGKVLCRTASTAASKTILVKDASSNTLMTFTTPASAGASTPIVGVRTTGTQKVVTAPALISLVAHASLASKTFDITLELDEHAILPY